MAESDKRVALQKGVITFLDVLGWKGVYDRKRDAISSLKTLVEGLQSLTKTQRGRVNGDTIVKSISDTIAAFTACAESEAVTALSMHAELCQWIIPRSIDAEIPVRGAIAFGEFEIHENIFVGMAVDEASAWHEHGDWIGVHLTPSAEYVLDDVAESDPWVRFTPPNKTRLDWKPRCVDWTSRWSDRGAEVAAIKAKFRRLGPILPEIATKFTNTLSFIAAAELHSVIPSD
jgi:hypothetical protein